MRKLLYVVLFVIGSVPTFGQTSTKADLALQYYMNGEFEKAAELYDELYDRRPTKTFLDQLTDCYIQLGEYKGAEKVVKKHIKLSKNNPQIFMVMLGDIYEKEGELKDAKEIYEEAIESLEKQPHMVYNLAQAFIEKQEFEYALKTYEKAESINENQVFNFQKATLYSLMGNTQKMFDEYLGLLEFSPNYLQAIKNNLARVISEDADDENNIQLKELLLKRVQGSEPNPVFTDMLVWLFIQEKSFNSAFIQLKAIDKRTNGNQKEIFDLASIALTNEDYSVALKCFNYIIEVGEESPFYLDGEIGVLYVLREKIITKNNYTYQELLDLENRYYQVLKEFGKTRHTVMLMKDLAHLQAFYLNNLDTATALLEEAITIPMANSHHIAEAKLELGDIMLLQGETWDAILLYSQVDKAFKEATIGEEAKFRRAKVSYYQGDFEWAQAQLDVLKASTSKLIANDAMKLSLLISDNTALDTTLLAMGIYARADLKEYQNKDSLALVTLDTIITKYKGHTLIDESHFKKAYIYKKNKNYAAAAEEYQTIIDVYSFDILADDAYFQLAKLYENYLGDKNKAKDLYEQILLKFTDSIYTIEARKRFRALRGDILN